MIVAALALGYLVMGLAMTAFFGLLKKHGLMEEVDDLGLAIAGVVWPFTLLFVAIGLILLPFRIMAKLVLGRK